MQGAHTVCKWCGARLRRRYQRWLMGVDLVGGSDVAGVEEPLSAASIVHTYLVSTGTRRVYRSRLFAVPARVLRWFVDQAEGSPFQYMPASCVVAAGTPQHGAIP